jgi:threonine aldolase
MDRVRTMIRDLFEAPEAAVYLHTGTANSIALATLTQPWETIFCTKLSHINERM